MRYGGANHWLIFTSESDFEFDSSSDTPKVKITHVVFYSGTAFHQPSIITLDVNRSRWTKHWDKIKSYLMKIKHEQEEVHGMWSVEDVIKARTKAEKLFI